MTLFAVFGIESSANGFSPSKGVVTFTASEWATPSSRPACLLRPICLISVRKELECYVMPTPK
jgi:hypothetical protein